MWVGASVALILPTNDLSWVHQAVGNLNFRSFGGSIFCLEEIKRVDFTLPLDYLNLIVP